MDYVYTLEPLDSGGSNEYLLSIFSRTTKKKVNICDVFPFLIFFLGLRNSVKPLYSGGSNECQQYFSSSNKKNVNMCSRKNQLIACTY